MDAIHLEFNSSFVNRILFCEQYTRMSNKTNLQRYTSYQMQIRFSTYNQLIIPKFKANFTIKNKNVTYQSAPYKSAYYKSTFYTFSFYKCVFYKSSQYFTNPVQFSSYNMPQRGSRCGNELIIQGGNCEHSQNVNSFPVGSIYTQYPKSPSMFTALNLSLSKLPRELTIDQTVT